MYERLQVSQIDTKMRSDGSREPLRIPGGVNSDASTVAALGSLSSDAAALTAQLNLVTGADGTVGVELPAAADATAVYVHNTSLTAALKVWPVDGGNDNINSLSEDAAFVMGPGKAAWFLSTSGTQWYVPDAAGVLSTTTEENYTDVTPGTASASKAVVLGASSDIDLIKFGAIGAADSTLAVDGQATAQGGTVTITGGTSSTAGNLGGAVSLIGGTPGSTSVGGAATVRAGAGGSASGNGAVAQLVGGAGTAGNATGGIGKVVGGAGQGSAAGGAAEVTGGAGGATGIGGQVTITGGAPTDAAGGAVVVAGAAGVGTNRAGGLVSLTGGASTGSATGGVASLVGGAAGAATGAGGGVVITGANGNTTGAAGTVVIKAGEGGATNVAGGVASLTGGVGNGTGIGGVASLVGGVGGTSGATGKGGAAKVTGGASVATNADGGAAIIAGGAKNGTAFIGPVILGNAQLTPIWYPQAAPKADAGDAAQTISVAEMVAGIVSATPAQARAVTTPTGAELDAGVAFGDVPATFGFDFSVQNRAAFAATDDILTLTAGATGVTVTGSAVVSPGSTALFRATRTGTETWIIYKIAG